MITKQVPHILIDVHLLCCDNKLKIKIPITKRHLKVICYKCWLVYDGVVDKKKKYQILGRYQAGQLRIKKFDKSKKRR